MISMRCTVVSRLRMISCRDFLQLGIALKAQFGRKAHHGGFTDPHRFPSLAAVMKAALS